MGTAILDLNLYYANSTLKRILRSVYRGVDAPLKTYQEKTLALPAANTTPQTYLGNSGAVLTVAIVDYAVDVLVTQGAATMTFPGVTTALVLPGSVTSLQFTNQSTTQDVSVYVFQAA